MILPFWQRLLPDPAKLASIVFDTASKQAHKQPIETAEHSDPTGTANGVRPEANTIERTVTVQGQRNQRMTRSDLDFLMHSIGFVAIGIKVLFAFVFLIGA